MTSRPGPDWAHAISICAAILETMGPHLVGEGDGRGGGSPRERSELPPSLRDATTDDRRNDSADNFVPLIPNSGDIVCEGESPEESEETCRIHLEVKTEPNSESAPLPASNLRAGIAENNTELTEQIVDAIALTNSISGMNMDRGALGKLKSLFPGDKSNRNVENSGSAPSKVPTTFVEAAPVLAPIAGQELSLLSLLSSSSSYLTPNEMALPLNDPSIFMPTPFAPGQDANTLIQQQQHQQPQVPAPSTPINSALPTATHPDVIPAAQEQQLLQLQQLATGYSAGGGQPIYPQVAAGMSGMIPPNHPVGGNTNPMLCGLNLFAGTPQGLAGFPHYIPQGLLPGMPQGYNHGLLGLNPGVSSGLNNGIADTPAPLHPDSARISSQHSRTAAFPNMNNLSAQKPTSESSTSSIPINQSVTNNTVTPSQRQSSHAPDQLNRFKAESLAAPKIPGGAVPQHNPVFPTNNRARERDSSSDLLIKSREARWIIRYNELLEFRKEHDHCRVPHGYATNRKLSWWVMNQRAQFAHRNQGKKTWLTDDRIQLLNDIGFIWTPHSKKSSGGKKKEEKSESSSGGEEEKAKNNASESIEDCKGVEAKVKEE